MTGKEAWSRHEGRPAAARPADQHKRQALNVRAPANVFVMIERIQKKTGQSRAEIIVEAVIDYFVAKWPSLKDL